MTRPHVDTTERDLARRQRGVEGLPMFSPVPSVVVEGAGQKARKAARERSEWSRPKCYRLVEMALAAMGRNGATRTELHRATGIPMNTVNPVVVEMRAFTDARRVVTEGKRGTESRVILARLRHP